jgi:CubicO group peptidase (beta-lactamase class C family)
MTMLFARSPRPGVGSLFGLVLLVAVAVIAAGSPESAPHDPAAAIEAAGRRFVEAVNSGDDSVRAAAVREIFSEESLREKGVPAHVAFLGRLAGDLGRLEFHHAEVTTMRVGETVRRSLHVYVRSGSDGEWKDLQFQLDPDPPYKLRQLFFIASVAEPVYLPNGPIADPNTLAWLDGYSDKLVRDDDLSGALLVAVGETPIVERYFGYADSARTVPCGAHTRFNLGSGNKMFTALALAGLVKEGKLRFDDTLDRYFPDFPRKDWARKATVGNLLSHTSGVGEYWTDENDRALARVTNFREILPMIERGGIDFPPGKGASYSNSNFILAGLIVEAVTGEDYYDVVRERIYRRAGMSESDSYPLDGSVPSLAEPLVGSPRAWRRAPRHIGRGTPAGGGFSTPRDILKFSRALTAGKIVGKEMLAEMTRSHTDRVPGAPLDYGYGFMRETSGDGVASFGHGGIAPGVNFEYRYFPASDVTLVAFCNQDNGAYDSLRKTVTRLITGER